MDDLIAMLNEERDANNRTIQELAAYMKGSRLAAELRLTIWKLCLPTSSITDLEEDSGD